MSPQSILIVDDYPQLVRFLTDRLSPEGYQVRAASTGAEGLAIVREGFVGVVLLDVQLPDSSGLDLFQEIRTLNPDLPVIVITAHATVDMAVEAVRRGAFDFIAKGSDLLKRLTVSVKNAFEKLAMARQLESLKTQLSGKFQFDRFITVSPRMRDILRTLEAVVGSGVTVLIEGESGTGKELVAHAIHYSGNRRDGPFVPVNCAGIPETLLESEMFGYEKGAFTGAVARRAGKFEVANGGTLFLDEVGELPKALQAKLLRVLQDHAVERVGGHGAVTVDVRVIAATNRDLHAEVRKGNFREDLYYRLSVFPVRLLPLRERPEDVPVLAVHFLKRFSAEEGKNLTGFARTALDSLASYSFPGNVRELENVIRYATLLAHGPEITTEDIVAALGRHWDPAGHPIRPDASLPLRERLSRVFPTAESIVSIQDVESAYVLHAKTVLGSNMSRVARVLGVGRATLYRWEKEEGSG